MIMSLRTLFVLLCTLLCIPQISFGVTGEEIIPSWVTPTQAQAYQFSTHVVLTGTWQLPPQWAGFIEVYQDATIDPYTRVPLDIGTLRADVNTGRTAFVINNASSSATSTGSFSIDIGNQTSGNHNLYLKFWGGTECALNTALNEQNAGGISNRTPVCGKNADNFAPGIVWPAREFTVDLPLWPVMVITPSSTPAMDFANTTFGTQPQRTFLIENFGGPGATLQGSLVMYPPFSCGSSCSYTINPGGSKTITVTFSPTTSPASFSSSATFSCNSFSAYGCDGGPSGIPTYQTYQVVGNSVDGVIPPAITISPSGTRNYGNLNLGIAPSDFTVTVRNTGGGILNGAVSFSPASEYSCAGNPTCSYSIFAGGSATIQVHFVPAVAGSHTDTANFSGGLGASLTLTSYVNDLPIVSLYNAGVDSPALARDFGKVNVGGSCPQYQVYFRDSGSGVLSGTVSGVPVDIGGALKLPGFSLVSGTTTYAGMTNSGGWYGYPMGYNYSIFQFCPSSGGYADAWVTFTNDLNPMASGTVHLYGNGNVLPIGVASGLTLTFSNVLINTTATRTITVSNTGVGVLSGTVAPATWWPSVYKCTSTGVHGDSSCNYNIPAGSSTVFTFTFTPTAVTSYNNDTMYIPGVGTTTLSGAGVQPNFKMSYSASPNLAAPATILPPSPKSYTVGSTIYGGSLSIQNKKFYLYLMNVGSGANVTFAFSTTSAPHFPCLTNCSGTLSPGNPITATLEYQPDAAASFTEPVIVDYNYGDGVPRSVQLDVTADSQNAPYMIVTPTANIDLGNVAVGATSTATFTVTNYGVGALNGTVSLPSLVASDPLSGLISRWTFDTADLNWTTHGITDVSGNGNTAYLPGPVSATGKYSEALNFMGSGAVKSGTITGLSTGNAVHTTALWIKITSLPSYRNWIALLGQQGSSAEHWLLNSNGSTQLGVWNGAQCSPNLSGYIGTWVHVALVHDGYNLKCYVNKTLVSTVAATYNFTSTALSLGDGRFYNNEQDFDGLLDDVRVYNRALTAAEISQIYTGSVAPSGMVLRYSFDDPTVVWSQMKVTDMSTKANDGSLVSIPTVTTGKIGQAFNFSNTYLNEITTSNQYSNPQNFSIGAWFRTSSASGRKIIGFENLKKDAGGSYDRHLYMGWDGKIHFGVYNGGQQIIHSLTTLTDGVWHQVLGTHDAAGNTALYVDGVLQSSMVSGAENYSGYWRIGGFSNGWSYMNGNGYFTGSIDDVRVYNRALNATEAKDLFEAGVSSGMANFTCVLGCTFNNLLNGDSQTVKIDFTPTQSIGYVAYPLFTSNGGNIGYPAAPYPSITGVGVLDPMITVAPGALNFPTTNLGLSTRLNLVIENTGLGDLVGNVSPVRSAGLSFYCFSNCNYNLAPGASTTAVIEFSPNATGTVSSVITLTSNAKNSPSLSVPVFGDGKFAPIIDPRGGDTNYGKVVVGKKKSQTFTLDNSNSTADLGSGTFVVTGPFKCIASADGFDVNGDCIYNLPAGGSATITIEFSPVVVGGLPATSVNTGSVWLSGVPLARFFVQGIGVPPTVKFIEE